MIALIFLYVLIVFVLFVAFVLWAPLRLRIETVGEENTASVFAVFSIISRRLLCVSYSVAAGVSLRVLGRELGKKKTEEGAPKEEYGIPEPHHGHPQEDQPSGNSEDAPEPEEQDVAQTESEDGSAEKGPVVDFGGPSQQSGPDPEIVRPSEIERESAAPHVSEREETPSMETQSEPYTPPSPKEHTTQGAEQDDGEEESGKIGIWEKFKQGRVYFFLKQTKLYKKVLRWFFRILGAFLRVIVFASGKMRVRASTPDPAWTGMIYGYVNAVGNALRTRTRTGTGIIFDPVFGDENVLEFNGHAEIRTSIGRLLYPFAVAVVFFPYLSVFITWRRMKKQGLL